MNFEFDDDDRGDDGNSVPLSRLVNLPLSHASVSSILPGPFVVLQGSPGDGMANTIDSMPVLPPPTAVENLNVARGSGGVGGGGGGGRASRRNSATSGVKDRIPDKVLEELDSEVSEESGEDVPDLKPAASSVDSNAPSSNQRRPRSDSDTEGGLHLPLGATSPIMRNAHHGVPGALTNNYMNGGFNTSPMRGAGGRELATLTAAIDLPLVTAEDDGDSSFLKRRSTELPKSAENNSSSLNGQNFSKRRIIAAKSEDDDGKETASGYRNSSITGEQETGNAQCTGKTPSGLNGSKPRNIDTLDDDSEGGNEDDTIGGDLNSGKTPAENEDDSRGGDHNSEKTPAELQATQQWQRECRQQELMHLEESEQNVKLLLQRRKRSRDRARIVQQQIDIIADGRSDSPVGTATSVSSSSADSVSLSSQPLNIATALAAANSASSVANSDSMSPRSPREKEEDPLSEISLALELAKNHRAWYQKDGRLVVFKSLPHMSLRGVVAPPTMTRDGANSGAVTLDPGCTVMAEAAYVLDSRTLRQLYPPTPKTRSASKRKPGSTDSESSESSPKLSFLKITSPHSGYVLSAIHSYPLLLPGLPTTYTSADHWLWRVTCQPDGAFIRRGLELVTDHLGTLPYGTVCKVKRKVVNGMGLNRLKVEAHLQKAGKDEESAEGADAFGMTKYCGYISEFLNPLSGQRGNVVEPIPFPVPVLYKVVHAKGCVVRSGVELSTSQIGHAPRGAVLSVVGRAYSDHPGHNCLERLRLAGGGGWISVTLNRRPPGNDILVEMVGVDGGFDPRDPARFHFESVRKVMEELHANIGGNGGDGASDGDAGSAENRGRVGGAREDSRIYYRRLSSYADLSEIGDDDAPDQSQLSPSLPDGSNAAAVPTLFRSGVVPGLSSSSSCLPVGAMDAIRESSPDARGHHLGDHGPNPNRCLICLSDERTATIVHGETGHIACCLTCARILKARGDSCPVCRLPIDLVIQQFWA